jgi:ribosomal protein L37AE/L43A
VENREGKWTERNGMGVGIWNCSGLQGRKVNGETRDGVGIWNCSGEQGRKVDGEKY